jgi:sugar (pentulose or hexulose) kinase
MDKKYIIGVDGGSQSSKVVIYDLSGNVVCEGKEPLKPMHLAEPCVVEHPDDDLWDSIVIASQKAIASFKGNKADIVGLGLCTIRFCRCLLKKDGTLAQPVLSWMDKRVSRPYEHLNPDVAYVTTTTGYITHRFTGQFNDTAANYQGMWPIDTDTWQWSVNQEYFDSFNIPRSMLFNLQMPGTILGYVSQRASEATGIPAGIPVVATGNDKAVEALGAGLLSEKTALISLGTYICSMVQGQENPKGTQKFWTNFANIPSQYLYESYGIRRGMWTVSWFKDLLGDDLINKASEVGLSPEDFLNQEASAVPPGSCGLMTVLEWLAPPDQPYKKGLMIGFDARHQRAHMYRSILEGIALTMKNRLDDMCDELNIQLQDVIVSGGGSNSDLMMQIFADVCGLPARRNFINGSASLGSAISVAVGLNIYKDYRQAVKAMVRGLDVFEPIDQNVSLYQKMNQDVYRDITQTTDEVLKKSYPLFNQTTNN